MKTMRYAPILLLAALLVTVAVRAQSQSDPVVIGESTNLRSDVLKESRSLLVSKPAGYESGSDRYPVLYLLDGETHFHYTSGIVRFLAENERIPKMLVVGIPSGGFARRTRDLTPPSASEVDNRFSPGNGGADAFLSFLANELIPYIERSYRTRPYRMLVGHSYGGLFGIHTLITKPKLFNAYIAIDPSLSWNGEAVVAQAELFLSKTKALQADLYLTTSNADGSLPSSVRRLTAILDQKAPAEFHWKFEWMKEETHTSIPLRSIHHGLETVFDGWHLTNPLELFDKGGIQAIHQHFRDGGRRCGYERTTPPFTVSLVVSGLMKLGRDRRQLEFPTVLPQLEMLPNW